MDVRTQTEQHYARSGLLDAIVDAVRASGKDPARLSPADLAPVDEFHIRGRDGTVELAGRAALQRGLRVLDVGCGLGGSARYLASEFGCQVIGIDVTREYVEAAEVLARMVGLSSKVRFQQASALELPFREGSFDVVWTEHAQMNIADKARFYGGLARLLKPGGRLMFHDIFRGSGAAPVYPVPWADEPSISFLALAERVRDLLLSFGLTIADWDDRTEASVAWFRAMGERIASNGRPPLGLHLLMGPTAPAKFANMVQGLAERRIVAIQAVAARPRA